MLYNPIPALNKKEEAIDVSDFLDKYKADAINKAIEEASEKGIRNVFVPSGEYEQNNIVMRSHITLFGNGFSSKLIRKGEGNEDNFVDVYDVEDFAIMLLYWDSNDQLGTGSNGYGFGETIDLDDGAKDGLLAWNYLTRSTQEDLDMDNCENITILGNVSYRAGKSGIHLSNNAKNCHIINNYVQEAHQKANARGGITQVNGADNNYYFNNVVVDCWRNYDINNREDGKGAIWGYNVSEGGEKDDVIEEEYKYLLDPPSDIEADEVTNDSITLKWSGEDVDDVYYEVYRDGEKVGETDKEETKFKDEDLDASTEYEYKIRTVFNGNDHKDSDKSSSIKLETEKD